MLVQKHAEGLIGNQDWGLAEQNGTKTTAEKEIIATDRQERQAGMCEAEEQWGLQRSEEGKNSRRLAGCVSVIFQKAKRSARRSGDH